jgi:hypothetical protein
MGGTEATGQLDIVGGQRPKRSPYCTRPCGWSSGDRRKRLRNRVEYQSATCYLDRSAVKSEDRESCEVLVNLYNLNTGKRQRVGETSDGNAYEDVSLSGAHIVAVRVAPSSSTRVGAFDLVLLNVHGSLAVNLTHNWAKKGASTGVSVLPSLWQSLVMFQQAPSPYTTGDIVLWKLGSGHYPIWRTRGRSWLIDTHGERPIFLDGLGAWEAKGQVTVGIFDTSRGESWILQDPRNIEKGIDRYVWSLAWVGNGRNIILVRQRSLVRTAPPVYFVWHIPAATCGKQSNAT